MRHSGWIGLMAMALGCAPKTPQGPTGGDAVQTAEADPAAARAVLEESAGRLDVSVRRLALELLVEVSASEDVGAWADRGLWDPSPYVQRAVISALDNRLPEPSSQQRLQTFVGRDSDLDPYSRCAAASRLARLGDVSTLAAVQAAYQDEALWRAAPCALAAAQMGDAAARQRLKAALEQGALPLDVGFMADVGRAALGEDVAAALSTGLGRLEPEMKLAAAAALVQMGDPTGSGPLRQALSGSGDPRQMEAIDFLIQMPGAEAA
ncbi:MAG: HEAT repeat domain-containing protein, partial [Myxococcota bacterium]